ncbi:MAG: type IV pilus biogenesis/stability protein PilW [Endozoicomonas sp. (ex Botrylloides leachii)]|nr:type IV pilus biogenesis/stability protein PilW [Endozoicomonas sp. (ex Botrylloides leachii)]
MGSPQALIAFFLPLVLSGCVSNSDHDPYSRKKAVGNYINLAKGYLQEGYTEKAIKPLGRALEIDPHSAEVYGMFGLLYQIQGEAQQAEESFKKALSYNPNAADVQNNHGGFLFSQGRLDDAYRQFEKAANNIDYEKRSRAFENLGIVALQQGKVDIARKHFEKSLRLNSNLARARLELAAILNKQGNYRSAWSHYIVFTKQARQTSRSLWLGVQLARANGNRDAAASYKLQLERLFPNSKELKTHQNLVNRNEY